MQIFALIVGWILGIASSLIFRWSDRRQKIGDFKSGLITELKEVLPVLAGTRHLLEGHLNGFTFETLAWVRKMFSLGVKDLVDKNTIDLLEKLQGLPEKELMTLSQIRKEKLGIKGQNCKKYYLNYLEQNMSLIPLLEYELQERIFRILRLKEMFNQEVDDYYFYFWKTFDPGSMEVNKVGLLENIEQSLKILSDTSFRTGNEMANLINKLEGSKKEIK